MKVLILFVMLNSYIWKWNIFFFKKIFSLVFSFFYLLEYIIIFILSNLYIYVLFLYKYCVRNNLFLSKREKTLYNTNRYMKKKKIKTFIVINFQSYIILNECIMV